MEKFDKLRRAKLSCKACGESLYYDQEGRYVPCQCGGMNKAAKATPKAI